MSRWLGTRVRHVKYELSVVCRPNLSLGIPDVHPVKPLFMCRRWWDDNEGKWESWAPWPLRQTHSALHFAVANSREGNMFDRKARKHVIAIVIVGTKSLSGHTEILSQLPAFRSYTGQCSAANSIAIRDPLHALGRLSPLSVAPQPWRATDRDTSPLYGDLSRAIYSRATSSNMWVCSEFTYENVGFRCGLLELFCLPGCYAA